MKTIVFLLTFSFSLLAYEIIQTPIKFDEQRIQLTKEYIKKHS